MQVAYIYKKWVGLDCGESQVPVYLWPIYQKNKSKGFAGTALQLHFFSNMTKVSLHWQIQILHTYPSKILFFYI